MRKAFVISLLAVIVLAGCQVNEIVETTSDSKSFTASIEDSFNGGNTRTSLDDNGNVLFKMGDQISIFAGSTVNEHYQVTDASDGKTSAVFNKVTGSGFVGGGEIDNNVAFYPYAASAEISKNGSSYVISEISLPATQNYAEGSFGNGAFPMAAVTNDTDDMHLKFKNVLGGLKIQLKGTATITSITVTGNTNEILCGAAEVTVSNTSAPSINLTDATAKTVTLDCGEGVALDPETATAFIIALPPMTMEGGFTVVVTDSEYKQMEIKTTKSQTINRSMLLKMPVVTYEGIIISSPLTFTSTGETSISLVKVGNPDDVSLEYRVNGGRWTTYTVGDDITLADGEEVSFRSGASGNTSFGKTYDDYHKFTVSGSGTVAASGSIMSLINQEESLVIPSPRCFSLLFYGCTSLTTAPELPATTLATGCYNRMFRDCTSMTTAPELPATTLAEDCYMNMFRGCTSLTAAPELPATTLERSCYYNMFGACSSLTTAPELPATTLAASCYMYMFQSCTSLTTAPELPATTLAEYCYSYMFFGCSSLTAAPELPATTLAEYCYHTMFASCTSLITAPELPALTLADHCYEGMFENCYNLYYQPYVLPATTLAEYCYSDMFFCCYSLPMSPKLPAKTLAKGCYQSMFVSCTSLKTMPELPATTLAESCYSSMFRGCSNTWYPPSYVLPATTLATNCYDRMFYGCYSMTTAPELPATTLAEGCYNEMFYGCSRLNYIKALFTTTPGDNYTYHWVNGVASTGTFVKSKDATWDVTGVNGVPEGWTVSDPPAGAVDLGIMMTREDGTTYKLYWAKSNLSTSGLCANPEDYGDHYAWGETETKSYFSWEHYKWCNGSYVTLTKYNTSSSGDNKTVLEPEDDVAHVKLGGKWRMPTDAEWTALREQCTWTWITQNGKNGRLVTAPNGNSIFLPAAGYRDKSTLLKAGSYGLYWSSSLSMVDPSGGRSVYFVSDKVDGGGGMRYNGYSVRPVSE